MTIATVLAQVTTVVLTVSGIAQASATPGETQNTELFAIPYVNHGVIGIAPVGTKRDLFDVAVDVLKTRTWLPNDIAALLPLLDTIPAALVAEVSSGGGLFGGTIQTFERIEFTLLPSVEYASVTYIGYRFMMKNAKILVDL